MSGGEAIREEKRLGHTLRCSSTDLLQVTSNPVSLRIALSLPVPLRIALSLPWFAAVDEPTRVEAVSSRKR